MAEEEFEGEPVIWMRLVCRGLEGGLRETVAASEFRSFHKGQVVTLAVDAVVDHVAFPGHKPLDDDDEDEGVDRLHITKAATVAIIDRTGVVATALDSQAERNEAARSERESARAERKREKAEQRKAAKAAAKAKATPPGGVEGAQPMFGDDGGEDDQVDDDAPNEAERRAMEAIGV